MDGTSNVIQRDILWRDISSMGYPMGSHGQWINQTPMGSNMNPSHGSTMGMLMRPHEKSHGIPREIPWKPMEYLMESPSSHGGSLGNSHGKRAIPWETGCRPGSPPQHTQNAKGRRGPVRHRNQLPNNNSNPKPKPDAWLIGLLRLKIAAL